MVARLAIILMLLSMLTLWLYGCVDGTSWELCDEWW